MIHERWACGYLKISLVNEQLDKPWQELWAYEEQDITEIACTYITITCVKTGGYNCIKSSTDNSYAINHLMSQ